MTDSAISHGRPASRSTSLAKGTRPARHAMALLWSTWSGRISVCVLGGLLIIAVFAPWIAPYDAFDRTINAEGEINRLVAPSLSYPFGTTDTGYDVLSQVIWGTRRTLFVGVVAGLTTLFIGVNVGLIAGYVGGTTDKILMRMADSAYAIPFIPLAIVSAGVLGASDWGLIAIIAMLFWRTTARVVRSQVLTLKERTFVKAAVVGGASRTRVLYRHLAPNVISLSVLYGILLIAEAIMAEAGLSFLGLAPPGSISWGTIMFDAYAANQTSNAWWWSLFPGAAIMLVVYAVSLLGRAYDTVQVRRRAGGVV